MSDKIFNFYKNHEDNNDEKYNENKSYNENVRNAANITKEFV